MPVLEISDLIGPRRSADGERQPIVRREVVAQLLAAGDRRAARIVERLQTRGEHLDPEAVDRSVPRCFEPYVHCRWYLYLANVPDRG